MAQCSRRDELQREAMEALQGLIDIIKAEQEAVQKADILWWSAWIRSSRRPSGRRNELSARCVNIYRNTVAFRPRGYYAQDIPGDQRCRHGSALCL